MYHSISEQDDPGRHPYYQTNTRPEVFARHMQFLADNGYTVISLSTAVSLLSGSSLDTDHYPLATDAKHPSPVTGHRSLVTDSSSPVTGHRSLVTAAPRYAVLTWDDGYRDFYDNAWPILKKYGLTATMFLPTGFIGNECNALNGKDCLTWDQVKVLASNGTAFGAHTVSHVQLYELYKSESKKSILSFLRKQESTEVRSAIEHELRASKQAIEEKLGRPVIHYSYAYAFPEQDKAFVSTYETLLQAAGYTAAVSTRIGTAMPGDSLYLLKRIPVNSHDDIELLQAKLEGGYDWLNRVQVMKKQIRFAG